MNAFRVHSDFLTQHEQLLRWYSFLQPEKSKHGENFDNGNNNNKLIKLRREPMKKM